MYFGPQKEPTWLEKAALWCVVTTGLVVTLLIVAGTVFGAIGFMVYGMGKAFGVI